MPADPFERKTPTFAPASGSAPLPLEPPPEQPLRRRAVLASVALHASLLLLIAIAAYLRERMEEAQPILVELVDSGDAGLAGGSGGGGGTQFASAAPLEGPEPMEASSAPAPSAAIAPPVEAMEATPMPAPPVSEPEPAPPVQPLQEIAEAAPAPAPSPLPTRKPTPPVASAPAQAAAPPSPAPVPEAVPSPAPPAEETTRTPTPQPDPAQAPALERSPHTRQAAGPGQGAPGAAANAGALGSEGAGRGASGTGKAALAGSGFGAGDDYLKRLRRWIEERMEYPPDAKKRKEEGEVVLAFVIARDGTILSTEIRKSSGYPGLDQAVVAMLGRASPVPPLPADFPGDQARVVLPFQFELSLINRVF
jgi:periplasmic protein TonB